MSRLVLKIFLCSQSTHILNEPRVSRISTGRAQTCSRQLARLLTLVTVFFLLDVSLDQFDFDTPTKPR
jgi:hypothetical protein